MTILDSRTSRVLFTAFLFAVGLGFLYAARRTLILFLFAIFFAYLINPAVGRLEKLVRSRVWAITIIYLLLLVGLALFGFLVGPRIARQSARLGASLPGLMDKASTGQLSGQIGQIAARIGSQHGWSDATQKRIQGFLLSRREDLSSLAQRIGIRAAEAAQEVWVLFLVPILAIFFLRDGGSFHEVLLALVQSRTQREFLQDVLQDLNQMLAQFIRAQLTLAALSFLAYTSVLGAMRVPYALMLGTAGGALEFVPVAGPLLAGAAMMIVAVLAGYPHWAFLLLVFVRLANGSGLRNLSPHHGSECGIASAGGVVRHSRGRRNRRNPRRLSLHPGDGQFAHRLAALAHLRRKTQVRPAQRVLVSARVGKKLEDSGSTGLARSHSAWPERG